MTRLCRLCGERPVAPARLAHYDYRCSRCRHQTPSQRAINARYRRSESRKRIAAEYNRRRIFVGHDYHSTAASVESARLINAHIKERRLEFVKRQSNREEAEGTAAR